MLFDWCIIAQHTAQYIAVTYESRKMKQKLLKFLLPDMSLDGNYR